MTEISASVPELAFLSQGKLHVLSGGSVTPVESAFAADVTRRESEIRHRHEWKTEGSGAKFLSGGMMLAADQAAPTAVPQVASVAQGRESGQLLYSIHVGPMAGLFAYDVANKREVRILHGRDDRLLHLSRPGPGNRVACSIEARNGARHLAVMDGDDYELSEVTEGDSRDEAPSWVEGRNALIYHSAGLARGPDGYVAGMSPRGIYRADLDSGEVVELAADNDHEYIAPRERSDGTLYFIRRSLTTSRNPFKWLLDFVLLPFRFLHAIFQWLNFFTLRYTGKPLSTDGQEVPWDSVDPDGEGDVRFVGTDASAVDSSWKLVRRAPDGKETELATGVSSFDLCPDGTILTTDGSTIFRLSGDPGDRTKESVLQAPSIEQIIVL